MLISKLTFNKKIKILNLESIFYHNLKTSEKIFFWDDGKFDDVKNMLKKM